MFGLIAVLSGCAVGPRYAAPQLHMPAHFAAAPANQPPHWPAQGWWRQFGSPELDHLIAQARLHNFSVRIAVAQLEQANAQVEVSGAPLLPSLTGNGSGNFQQAGSGSANSSASSSFSAFTNRGSKNIDTRQFAASLQVSYELDFWGKNRDALRAAEDNAAAAAFNRDTVALTAEAAVATAWFQALAYHDELQIARQNLAAAEQLLAQLRAELAAGIVDGPSVIQQEALVAGERANIPNLQSQLRQQIIGLGILTGEAPEFLHVQGGSLNNLTIPAIAPGLPAQLLNRRPDIAQSEATLMAANENVRSAIAAFFPTISLTGSAGYQSNALNMLFAPGSMLLNAATSLSQPIFEGGQLTGQLAVNRATYHQDVAQYEQSVVQAFTDVDNALTALHFATEQENLQTIAVDRAQQAVNAAQAQLQAGIIDVSILLNAQQTLLNDENTLVQVRLARFLAAVNLYKALGGGWVKPAPDQQG